MSKFCFNSLIKGEKQKKKNVSSNLKNNPKKNPLQVGDIEINFQTCETGSHCGQIILNPTCTKFTSFLYLLSLHDWPLFLIFCPQTDKKCCHNVSSHNILSSDSSTYFLISHAFNYSFTYCLVSNLNLQSSNFPCISRCIQQTAFQESLLGRLSQPQSVKKGHDLFS